MVRDVFSPPWEPPFQSSELTDGESERSQQAVATGSGVVATEVTSEVYLRIAGAVDQTPPQLTDQW